MADELVPAVDVERQTIRGRVCPLCGGKIIPSDRAVYQNATAPAEVFPAWQCERCGYEEISEKKTPAAKPAHTPKKKVEG
jgi:DNA-directed RNA polymerase subunit RPC12/RpoP